MLENLLKISAFSVDFFGYFLITIGVIFALIGAFGIVKLPDFYKRLHPAGIIDSFCLICVCLGAIFLNHFSIIVTLKLLILGFFGLILNATACYTMAKTAATAQKEEDFLGKSYKRQKL
jgi:multicomponent Na+:H+ antiporter subunit G